MNLLFQQYLARLQSKGNLPQSVQENRTILETFERWAVQQGLEPVGISPFQAQLYLDSLERKPATTARYRTILKAAWQFGIDLELLTGRNPWRLTVAPKARLSPPAVWTARDLRHMLAGCEMPTERLMLRCFMYTGMRIHEVVNLSWPDVDLDRNVISCLGKGHKHRLVPIHPALRKNLIHLEQIDRPVVGWSRTCIYEHLIRIINRAAVHRVQGQASHSFRKTVATSLHRNGVADDDIDQMLGWSPVSIRARYYQLIDVPQLHAAILKLYVDDPIENF